MSNESVGKKKLWSNRVFITSVLDTWGGHPKFCCGLSPKASAGSWKVGMVCAHLACPHPPRGAQPQPALPQRAVQKRCQ